MVLWPHSTRFLKRPYRDQATVSHSRDQLPTESWHWLSSSLVHSHPLSAPWGVTWEINPLSEVLLLWKPRRRYCAFSFAMRKTCLTQDALGYLEAKLYARKNTLLLNSSLQSTWMKNMFIHRISRTKFVCGPSPSIPHCFHSLGVDIFYCSSDISDSPSSRRRQCQPCSVSASSWIRLPASPLHMKPEVAINWVLISPSNI